MGSVWLAVDETLGREVAIKGAGHLPGESATDEARALREARSSAALNHPNVVALYDAVPDDGRVWLVMEYVEGQTLSELMRAEGPLDPGRVAAIGAQVADGLVVAHERGTVHRDIKPGNILVTADGKAKISDFGIARTLGEDTLTDSGMVTGTPSYFAPELARGAQPTTASDVWALGGTLYAAVEGRPPYREQSNALALLATIADQAPPAPERAGPLTEPIRRMMDPDPGSRWSMADAAHALHQRVPAAEVATLRESDEVSPVPAPASETSPPAPASEPAPAPQQRPTRRSRSGLVLALLLVLLLAGAGGIYLVARDDGSTTADPQVRPTGSGHRSPSATTTVTATSTAAATETATTSPSASGAPAGSRSGNPVDFVESYYALLPGDTEAGWSLLTTSYRRQTGGYDDYQGFWSGVSSVSVEGARKAGPTTVDVELVYDGNDRETRRLVLRRTSDGWLIDDSYLV